MKKIITSILILISLNSFSQVKVVKDTLVITNHENINWIKINGELYQVKKSVSIEKVGLQFPSTGSITIDKMDLFNPMRFYNKSRLDIIYN